jgi:hypothetical protein
MKFRVRLQHWQGLLVAIAIGLGWALISEATAQTVSSWTGKFGATRLWQLPDTPNGLKPSQSWHATGSAPDGSIYIGGMDHITNAALYRLEPSKGALRYVGDARSASEAVGNWAPGDTVEKFHTRPLWHQGKVYVASMDRVSPNEYLSRRGFHWYAYDPLDDSFTDLSAVEPGGTGAEHGSLVAIASDPKLNVIYGMAEPNGAIYRYDVSKGLTESLGRPETFDKKYLYSTRVMWVDSRSRLYFSAGHSGIEFHDPSIYGHIHYYDPTSGFGELKNWALQVPQALEVGQCLQDRKQCFFADVKGHIYRFDDNGPSWSYLGQIPTGQSHLFVFHVSADGRKAYVITSLARRGDGKGAPDVVQEFDLSTGTVRQLCRLADLDPALAGLNLHTGYDAWDTEGGFYISSFSSNSDRNVIVTRIDPVRLKSALGLIPPLTEVSVERLPDPVTPHFVIARTGSTEGDQEVLYKLTTIEDHGVKHDHYGNISIPRGATSIDADLRQLFRKAPSESTGGLLTIIANGNDYVLTENHEISF